jgi:transposase
MISLPTNVRVFMRVSATDMRMSFNGLTGLVQSCFERNVLDGHLFLFVNRRRDRVKILYWEIGGLVIWAKRLESGTLELPRCSEDQTHLELDATTLAMLLVGVPLGTKRRKRFQLAMECCA